MRINQGGGDKKYNISDPVHWCCRRYWFNSKDHCYCTPNRTISQPSDNTEKEAVSLAEVKPWLLGKKQKQNKTVKGNKDIS